MSSRDLTASILKGRYRLTRKLGAGGMGEVYEGIDQTLDCKVAVKILPRRLAFEEKSRARFMREAKAASKIRHPNVVQITDFGQSEDGLAFLVMEFLEGRDLRQLLRKEGPLMWPRVRRILLQIVSAIGASHDRNIVHRDIKPANFFVLDVRGLRDFIKLLDFGIAKLACEPAEEDRSLALSLTGTGEVFGTAKYMAPELAYGPSSDPRIDVYAVGVVAYEMLVGRVPFSGSSVYEILKQHVEDAPRPPRQLRPDVPVAVEALVLRAMAKAPEERFSSMDEMEAAILCIGEHVAALEAESTLELGESTVSGAVTAPALQSASPASLSIATRPRGEAIAVGSPSSLPESRVEVAGPEAASSGTSPAQEPDSPHSGCPASLPVLSGDTIVGASAALGAPSSSVGGEVSTPPFMPSASVVRAGFERQSMVVGAVESGIRSAPSSEIDAGNATAPVGLPCPTLDATHSIEVGDVTAPGAGDPPGMRLRVWMGAMVVGVALLGGAGGLALATMSKSKAAAAASGPVLVERESEELRTSSGPPLEGSDREEVEGVIAETSTGGAEPYIYLDSGGAVGDSTDGDASTGGADVEISNAERGGVSRMEEEKRPKENEPPEQSVGPSKKECEVLRHKASDAQNQRQWSAVLDATKERSCWSSSKHRVERTRMRVQALAEKASYQRCVRTGRKSSDPQTRAMVKFCQRKLDAQP